MAFHRTMLAVLMLALVSASTTVGAEETTPGSPRRGDNSTAWFLSRQPVSTGLDDRSGNQ